MNTKSIFALLPIDIKEIISDKLCEPDKQIHKSVMEDLLWMNTEMMVERYGKEIEETFDNIDNYDVCITGLDDLYQANKEYFDDLHTLRLRLLQHRLGPLIELPLDWIIHLYHSIVPSLVKKWQSRNCLWIKDDDGCPIGISHKGYMESDSDSD